jgi:hypothetical protein
MRYQRRTEALLVEELPTETVIYDTAGREAHCLDRVAAFVWNHCDGRTSPAELARLLRADLGLAADERMVRRMLEQLEALHLLGERPARPAGAVRTSRRTAARQLALMGLGGTVLTIAVPPPAAAASICNGCATGHAWCIPTGTCSGNLTACGNSCPGGSSNCRTC